MPELPEVETVRRGLTPSLEGRKIVKAVQNRGDLRWPLPERFAERLTGRRLLRLGRRAKYLLAELDGEVPETVLIHLGMSGRMLLSGAGQDVPDGPDFHHAVAADHGSTKHDHIVLDFEGGLRLVYNDARRFGSMDLWPTATIDQHPSLVTLGPEPLSNQFDSQMLFETLAGRKTSIKAALLDQRRVAGLGNIYVCEALYRSQISPLRLAGSLGKRDCTRLVTAIRDVLTEAIEAGGSSLRDFHGAGGELGYFQHGFAVYDREGAICNGRKCTAELLRIVQGGRSTFYCPKCQK